jgi:predicted transcriptional regulator of viral defense system
MCTKYGQDSRTLSIMRKLELASLSKMKQSTALEAVQRYLRASMHSADFFAVHPVFTRQEFHAARQVDRRRSRRTTDSILTRAVASGRLMHVRRGIYAVVPRGTTAAELRVDPFLVASKLAPDAAVAYHAALQFRGKAYSIWHRFSVLSRSSIRPLAFQGNELFGVRPPLRVRARRALGGGIVSEPYAGGNVRVTTLERTLVDVLDAPKLGGGWEEIWRSLEAIEYFDLDAVVAYALAVGSALTVARVGYFLQQHREALFVEERHLRPLRKRAPAQPRYLDSTRETGRLIKGWNLVVPERVHARTWEEAGDAVA